MSGPANYVAVTADAIVRAGNGRIASVVLTPAAAVATLILYDNASAASGNKILTLQAAANGGSVVFTPPDSVIFTAGCYADIGGTDAAAYVYLA